MIGADLKGSPRTASVDVVTDLAALADFERAWRALAESRENAFISPEWFRAWLARQPGETAPWVVVVRDEEGLRGLLPLVISLRERPRRLRFAGGPFGDYFHPVSAAQDEETVAFAAANVLAQRKGDWSVIILDNVDIAAQWVVSLRRWSMRRLAAVEDHREVLPYIDLSGISSWDDYLATRSRKFRAHLRRELRVLERDHAVRFRRTLSAAELTADVSAFLDLHERRWQTRGTSTLSRPGAHSALLNFAAAALDAGWLRLWFLEIDEQPIAAWFGWRIGQRYAHYQSGLDPAWSRRSAGIVLLGRTIRDAIEEGAAQYDMLSGGEAYKQRFANGDRQTRTLVLTRAWHPVRVLATTSIAMRRVARRLRL
ncbi:MAG TPA: GNAT family N-acetyltransferase [Gaiellaceae bacterium]|nr:GNAT family N-acetyltransferase [Gaiellaceae bacterium]